jgi:predicted membrane protein
MKIDAKDIEVDGFQSSTTFGDTFVTLSGAKLKAGINRLEISTTFGDITVVVPEKMEAQARASATFGNLHIFDKIADGISNSLTAQTPGYEAASAKLYIAASASFGDIKIFRG